MARKRDIDRLTLKWRDRLWLGHWLISTEIVEELEGGKSGGDIETMARTTSDATYRTAHIRIVRPVWDNRSPKVQNRTMAHEMVHVATSPADHFVTRVLEELPSHKRAVYEKWWTDIDETLTEHWANVLLEAFKELRPTDP